MKTAIILHGMPDKEEYYDPQSPAQSNQHWLPWLQKQLLLKNILAQTPELPEPYAPIYENWLAVFQQFKIDEDTMLIGHSCGAGFLVSWLSENNIKVDKVALVAPFLDPDKDEVESNFFDFKIDKSLAQKTKGINIFYAPEDDKEILTSVEQLKSIEGLQITQLPGKGHFVYDDMQTQEFPELLNWLT